MVPLLRGSAGGGLAAARAVVEHRLPMAASIAGASVRHFISASETSSTSRCSDFNPIQCNLLRVPCFTSCMVYTSRHLICMSCLQRYEPHELGHKRCHMQSAPAGGTHHAFRDRGEGFCAFNDIAVGAAAVMAEHGLERVLVIDLDVHQACFDL